MYEDGEWIQPRSAASQSNHRRSGHVVSLLVGLRRAARNERAGGETWLAVPTHDVGYWTGLATGVVSMYKCSRGGSGCGLVQTITPPETTSTIRIRPPPQRSWQGTTNLGSSFHEQPLLGGGCRWRGDAASGIADQGRRTYTSTAAGTGSSLHRSPIQTLMVRRPIETRSIPRCERSPTDHPGRRQSSYL